MLGDRLAYLRDPGVEVAALRGTESRPEPQLVVVRRELGGTSE
jgi:hypothetical protein